MSGSASAGAVLATALPAVAVLVGAAELVRASGLLACGAVRALLTALVALVASALLVLLAREQDRATAAHIITPQRQAIT